MLDLPYPLGTIVDLLIVILGFGAIVFIHELGHFLAARWAGIRVLTFAVGFGPALVSWRKGLGWRRGSSEAEYTRRLAAEAAGVKTAEGRVATHHGISPTEYRIGALPFGGYVRMLGQDDLNPGAVSQATDSYQRCRPWKRMVVISAGVVFNLISAALLFIVVFMVGMKVEPPRIGQITPDSPAARATATTPDGRTVGLEPGDTILSIDGETPHRFDAVLMAVAMASPHRPLSMIVERRGLAQPLVFALEPERSEITGLLDIGIRPPQTNRIEAGDTPSESRLIAEALDRQGLHGVRPGMSVIDINAHGAPTHGGDIAAAFEASQGRPVALTFADDQGQSRLELRPRPRFEASIVGLSTGGDAAFEHTLGLAGVLRVDPEADPKFAPQGLQPGDVFTRIGSVEYPSLVRGIEAIRAHAGGSVEAVVLRDAHGTPTPLELTLRVDRAGKIGAQVTDTAADSNLLSLPAASLRDGIKAEPRTPAAAGVITRPGSRLATIEGTTVTDLHQAREALRAATAQAHAAGSGATLTLGLTLPTPGHPEVSVPWTLTPEDVQRLHALGWAPPFSAGLFEYEEVLLRADGPVAAIGLGLEETKRVMTKTYLTFARLAQGTVQVEHLKGPVGIAHLGTRIAGRGPMWLLFFLALISVNLAVVNFLPLPIVDGGQFLMLVYEQLRGRPVPIPVQNAVSMAGLLLIAGAFLLITFNDVKALLGL